MDFYHGLARICAIQVMRAQGVDRARAGAVDCLADLLERTLYTLGASARQSAELRGCAGADVEDVHAAMERLHIDRGFLDWCKGQEGRELRRIAGEGVDDTGAQVGPDWLGRILERQVKSGDVFDGTILDNQGTDIVEEAAGQDEAMQRLGDVLR